MTDDKRAELDALIGDRIDFLAEKKEEYDSVCNQEMSSFFDGRLREAQWLNTEIGRLLK